MANIFRNQRRTLISIVAVMLSAIALVSILAWASSSTVNSKNGFNRQFIYSELKPQYVMENTDGIFDISGNTSSSIFFKVKDASKLIMTDKGLQNRQVHRLHFKSNSKINYANVSIVDSPNAYILASELPAVIKDKISPVGMPKLHRIPNAPYTRAVVLSPDTYIFRGFDTTLRVADQVFIKADLTRGITKVVKDIFEIGTDAGISTDGILHYDKTTQHLTYVRFYTNEFICLDTNLNTLYRGHTIDTVTKYQSSIEGTPQEGGQTVITNTLPKRFINWLSSVSNGRLYNNSLLQADNESKDSFLKSMAIDVYDTKSGKYLGSFYIPLHEKEKPMQFKVIDNSIIVVYQSNIVSYLLPPM